MCRHWFRNLSGRGAATHALYQARQSGRGPQSPRVVIGDVLNDWAPRSTSTPLQQVPPSMSVTPYRPRGYIYDRNCTRYTCQGALHQPALTAARASSTSSGDSSVATVSSRLTSRTSSSPPRFTFASLATWGLRTACKPPALICLRLRLAACRLKGG